MHIVNVRRCRPGVTLCVFTICLAASLATAARQTNGPVPDMPQPAGPDQPFPFSHRAHLALNVECRTCHALPNPGFTATLPPTDTCMRCHRRIRTDSPHIQRLTELHETGASIPWERVYELPEYVFFSHRTHLTSLRARATCDTCHGNVAELDVMAQVKDISMTACVDCHRDRRATQECDTCHDPR